MGSHEINEHIASLTTVDGKRIGYRSLGRGPGVVILPGAMMTSRQYVPMARLLAPSFTVIVPDRRGRGLSGPFVTPHGMAEEVSDLSALLDLTGADRVFGHSGGGVIALETALRRPIPRLAVFEPPLMINELLPVGWLPAFETALARGRRLEAMALFQQGMRFNWVGRLPRPLLDGFLWLALRGDEGHEAYDVLPTLVPDFRMLPASDPGRYGGLAAPTLILGGARSPDYLQESLRRLARVLPGATLIVEPGLDHSAPTSLGEAFERETVARELLNWFA